MYTACDRDLSHFYDNLLKTALFIDDSSLSVKSHHDELSRRGFHISPMGLCGDLAKRYAAIDFRYMIAALYIPFCHRVGYIHVESHLGKDEWDHLCNELPVWCCDNNVSLNDVTSRYDSPSLKFRGRHPPIVFYVGPNVERDWVVLHFANHWVDNKPAFGDNPLLSSVWLPGKSFDSGLVFTPFGAQHNAA